MHVVSIILVGLALLAVLVIVGRWMGYTLRRLLPGYLVVWLVASLVNMWIGVTQAGYSVAEEVLVLVPVFGIPALVAFLLARRM